MGPRYPDFGQEMSLGGGAWWVLEHLGRSEELARASVGVDAMNVICQFKHSKSAKAIPHGAGERGANPVVLSRVQQLVANLTDDLGFKNVYFVFDGTRPPYKIKRGTSQWAPTSDDVNAVQEM